MSFAPKASGRRGVPSYRKSLAVPGPVRKSLLRGGTAMLTGIVLSGMTAPAMAACAIINAANTPGAPSGGFWDVICADNVLTTDAHYKGGATPLLVGDHTYDFDIALRNDDETFFNGAGIKFDSGKDGAGFDVTITLDDLVAIKASGKDAHGINVKTSDTKGGDFGNITITSDGFIEALDKDASGIRTEAGAGATSIVNTGIIGVNFIDDLKVDVGFENGAGGSVTLTDGSAFVIAPVGGDGISSKSSGGSITINNGIVVENPDGTLSLTNGEIYATKDGISVETSKASGADNGGTAIEITNGGWIEAGGNGISAKIGDKSSTGDIVIVNAGHIEVDGVGISAKNEGSTGEISIYNVSENSIITGKDGIVADGNGADIEIFNGYNDFPFNLDGLIKAGKSGILATNDKGGDIYVFNNSGSEIYADGNYGISATSKGKDGSNVNGDVVIENLGLVEVQTKDGKAGIFGQTADDGDGGFVIVSNGASYDVGYEPNARVNAYNNKTDGTFESFEAGGIVIVKDGGTGGYSFGGVYESAPESYAGTYGALAFNYGMWDFSAEDNYLTPGFDGGAVGNASSTVGGIFAPGGSAFDIVHNGSSDTGIFNFGTAIGNGDKAAVINIESTDFGDNRIVVFNGYEGVIGSANTPYNWSYDPFEIVSFGFGGGSDWNAVNGVIDSGWLSDFADASDDKLMAAKGAGVDLFNNGLLIGQLNVDTDGENSFVNWGAWITTGDNKFKGDDGSLMENYGLIFTAVDGSGTTKTKFKDFDLDNYFVLSMIDGGAGDLTELKGNYYGGGGILGVDVDFGTEVSDIFEVKDNGGDKSTIGGSTGIVVHRLNETPGGLHGEIDVVVYKHAKGDAGNGTSIANPCDGLCMEDDAFFISELSQGYVNIGGYGATRHGLFASFLRQDLDDGDFELISDWGPDAHALPGLITGLQNIGHHLSGVAREHLYGNYFPAPGAGGSGADPVLPEESVAPSSGAHPALWARASGSWTDRDTTVVEEIGGVPVAFDTGFDQGIYSLLAGADYTTGNFRFGVYGGFVASNLDFNSYGMSADYTGGTIGAYGAYTRGGFYIDAEAKADFLDVDYSSPIGNVNTSATNIGLQTNAGYRYEMRSFYVEPNGTLAYIHSGLDDVNFGGASVDFGDGSSLRGGIGVKVGTTLASQGGRQIDLALSGKLWNEFMDANEVTFTDNVTLDTVTYQDSIDGIFGEVGGEVTFYSADRSLSGFVSGGVQFNDEFTTFAGKLGLRKKF